MIIQRYLQNVVKTNFDEGNEFYVQKKFGFRYRQSPHEDDAWESLEVWKENRLNGSSHHNMVKQRKVKQHKAMLRMNHKNLPSKMIPSKTMGRLRKVPRSSCRRRMGIRKCKRTKDELTLMSIRCRLGCCRHLGCKVLNRIAQSCKHLLRNHLSRRHLHRILSHHSPSQSSKFHASRSS